MFSTITNWRSPNFHKESGCSFPIYRLHPSDPISSNSGKLGGLPEHPEILVQLVLPDKQWRGGLVWVVFLDTLPVPGIPGELGCSGWHFLPQNKGTWLAWSCVCETCTLAQMWRSNEIVKWTLEDSCPSLDPRQTLGEWSQVRQRGISDGRRNYGIIFRIVRWHTHK